MTPAKAEALGRRWIAAGGGWREGMLSQHGERVLSLAPPTERPRLDIADPCPESRPPWDILTVRTDDGGPRVPDLSDAPTRGAALEVVRERLNDPGIFIRPRGSKARPDWAAFTSDSNLIVAAPTEEEALVAALEAAPERPR